jgi:hypothetical protein
MPNLSITGSDDLMRAVMASERMLANVRNAERLVDDLDALVYVAIVREFPGADPFEVDERLIAEAKRRLAEEVANDA